MDAELALLADAVESAESKLEAVLIQRFPVGATISVCAQSNHNHPTAVTVISVTGKSGGRIRVRYASGHVQSVGWRDVV